MILTVLVELPVWLVLLVVGGLLGSPPLMHFFVVRRLTVVMAALMERNRRRMRRESSGPNLLPTRRDRDAVPEPWDDDDNTDLHHLVELELKRPRPRRGERPPRPGTHHDR